MTGKCNFTNNNPLIIFFSFFPFFFSFFFFWIRFKQVHRNQGCFGSKLSRGRGSLVGARNCTNYTLKNLSPILWPHTPAHGQPRGYPWAGRGLRAGCPPPGSLTPLPPPQEGHGFVPQEGHTGSCGSEERGQGSLPAASPHPVYAGLALTAAPTAFPSPNSRRHQEKTKGRSSQPTQPHSEVTIEKVRPGAQTRARSQA